ncbi:MAG: ankyrin repeat domain-containing protein [Synechococcus sp. SB0662_bin_45]|nr:ankyrin repeat domain-containing protein [Synechococcus sp. SB0662_bin_45]MYG64867.1 ankyrin repeat domain-containing protein [Synechococcus sp. SB0675_bin_7]MYK06899.1 ankyrin repeat domain-containing protein [Synechococcus sp. SB0670_bin_20]MYK85747.1 ankyrin repeat domain-containing protein [Synechococcus sp. SB0669_bin_7]
MDDNGNTPLHVAVKKGKTDVVKGLIEAGASVDTTNENGLTPFDIAETMENLNLIQNTSLIQAGLTPIQQSFSQPYSQRLDILLKSTEKFATKRLNL